jgi:integrase
MPGKQAKILSHQQLPVLLAYACTSRYPLRNRLIIFLSVKAGLRAGEIAQLTWDMVGDATGEIGCVIELRDCIAKKGGGRLIPMHADVRTALEMWSTMTGTHGPVVRSERGGPMSPGSIVNWFATAYQAAGLDGCSSHSGRRTFITRAARLVHQAGGSLRDVQLLAGHRSIQTTQRYIDGDSDAQRRLVSLL